MTYSVATYQDCPGFFDSKASAYLDGIKYHASVCSIDYLSILYDSLTFDRAIELSSKLRDKNALKYITEKFNKTTLNDVYPDTNDISTNLRRAVSFYDSRGIKYLAETSRLDSHLLLYDELDLDSNEERVIFAINLGEVEAIDYVIRKNHLSEKEYLTAIRYSYYKEQLDIGAHLYRHAMIHRPLTNPNLLHSIISGILRSNPTIKPEVYQEHFRDLGVIDGAFPVKAFESLVYSMHHALNNSGNITFADKYIFSDVSEENNKINLPISSFFSTLRNQHFTVKDTVDFIFINSVSQDRVELFLPIYGTPFIGPFYAPFRIDDIFKGHCIYVPITWGEFLPSLIHEAAHALQNILFRNNALPYSKTQSSNEVMYSDGIEEVLRSIFLNFTKGQHSSLDNDVELRKLLVLHEHHHSRNNDLTEKLFSSYYGKEFDSITLEQKRLILERKYQEFSDLFDWTEEHKQVLTRILDYIKRDNEVKDQEFIVKIPELYSAEVRESIMSNFEPIISYWEKFITPLINAVRLEHFKRCKNNIAESDNIEECMIFSLTVNQAYEVWSFIVDEECDECLRHIYSNNLLIESISITERKNIVAYIASKTSFCTEYCYSGESCFIIPSQGLLPSIIQFLAKNAGLCTKVYNDTVVVHDPYSEMLQTILSSEYLLEQDDQQVLGERMAE